MTYQQVQQLSQAMGMSYQSFADVAANQDQALAMLTGALTEFTKLKKPDIVTTATLAGAVTPTLSLDAMMDRFWVWLGME